MLCGKAKHLLNEEEAEAAAVACENMVWNKIRQSVLCLSAAPNKENEEQKAKKERKNRKKKKIYWKNIELLDMDYD